MASRRVGHDHAAVSGGRPLRVCLVGPSLALVGGQSVQLDRLLQALRATPGVDVGFVAVNPQLSDRLAWMQRVRFVRTVVNTIAYLANLVREVRHHDVVHAFSPSYWAFLLGPVPALAVARLFGRGALLNYHSGEAADHLARWRTAVPLSRLAHRIVVPSGYLRDVFRRFGLETQVIPNFVDASSIPYRRRESPHPAFLSNRNLEPMYNVACTIRAFARIQARVPDATLVVAGDGRERARLEELVRALGLHHVRFTGRVPPADMPRLLDASDILLNSPDIDNMPLTLIEAQAAGLPIVSTSTGGIPFIVADGGNGLLVPPGDDEALAAAALRLLQEPGLAERLTTQARDDYVHRYTWPAVGPQWIRLYQELAQRSRGAAKA